MILKEITYFQQRNIERKHVTMVTDIRCFEKLGPDIISASARTCIG